MIEVLAVNEGYGAFGGGSRESWWGHKNNPTREPCGKSSGEQVYFYPMLGTESRQGGPRMFSELMKKSASGDLAKIERDREPGRRCVRPGGELKREKPALCRVLP